MKPISPFITSAGLMHLQWVNYFPFTSTPFSKREKILSFVNIGVRPEFRSGKKLFILYMNEPFFIFCIAELYSSKLNHKSCLSHLMWRHIHTDLLVYTCILPGGTRYLWWKRVYCNVFHIYKPIYTTYSWVFCGSQWPCLKAAEPCFQCSTKKIEEYECLY